MKNRADDEATANQIQVRTELQADCLAGVWANLNDQMKNRLQPGDVEEALNAATQIGDDMIQRKMTGRIIPDAFTHGTAEQRVRWFKAGLEAGRMDACDTFNTSESVRAVRDPVAGSLGAAGNSLTLGLVPRVRLSATAVVC